MAGLKDRGLWTRPKLATLRRAGLAAACAGIEGTHISSVVAVGQCWARNEAFPTFPQHAGKPTLTAPCMSRYTPGVSDGRAFWGLCEAAGYGYCLQS